MATFISLGGKVAAAIAKVRFNEITEPSRFKDSNNKPYVWALLANPVTVYCSTDKDIPASVGVDRLLVREEDLLKDVWEKDAEGMFAVFTDDKGKQHEWEADYSTGQGECLYQQETIRNWVKGKNQAESKDKKASAFQQIEQKNAERAAAKLANPDAGKTS